VGLKSAFERRSPVEFTGISILRVENGKIVEAWNNFDFMKMHQQLGALKFDAAT
jgi:predicted ester cyclase